jgi:hypothetical protein
MNPTLSDLIGGIQSVTLGDEEAKRRGTQKSILERSAPPTFDIVVEIQDWDRVTIHPEVDRAVDAVLRNQPPATEIRWVDDTGEVKTEQAIPVNIARKKIQEGQPLKGDSHHKLYLYGVNRGRFEQMAKEIQYDVSIVDNLKDANMFVTSKSHYRRKPQKVREAETTGLPIYVLRSNTPTQIRQFLNTIYPMTNATDRVDRTESLQEALSEAQAAVNQVINGQSEVELSPQSAYIRRLQHLIAERNELASQSSGREPQRRVRIFKG